MAARIGEKRENKKVTTNCANCRKEIAISENKYNKNKIHFCNKECHLEYQKLSSTILLCPVCGEPFTRKNSQLKKMKDTSKATCSKKCCYELRKILYSGENNHQYGLTGNKNSSWKSDEKYVDKTNKHYKMVRAENHPFKNADNFVMEHRLIAEKYLLTETNSIEINGSLYLKPECVVHHIDFDKHNNDVSNLYVFESETLHFLFHVLHRNKKVTCLEEFFEYYQKTYTEKLYNYDWLYKAYIIYDLSMNQISKFFNISYNAVQSTVKKYNLDMIKKEQRTKEKRLELIIAELSKPIDVSSTN